MTALQVTSHPGLREVVPADLKAVNDATSGEITIVVVDENLTDSPQNLADAFDEITSYEGNIVLTGQHTTEQLAAINEATIGSITTHATYNLEGSGTLVAQAVNGFGTDGYRGNVTLTDDASIDQINAISPLITGTLTLSSNIGLSGTAKDIAEPATVEI